MGYFWRFPRYFRFPFRILVVRKLSIDASKICVRMNLGEEAEVKVEDKARA